MTDFRRSAQSFLGRILSVAEADLDAILEESLSEDCVWDVAHPVNRLEGRAAIRDGFILPLRRALEGCHRRDEILMGGENRRAERGNWVGAVTHYCGNFKVPLFGISPCDRLVFLRAGEFYHMEGARIVAARIIIDLVDLMRQAGRDVLPRELGTEMLFPGPATHDGVLPGGAERSAASLDLVEAMLGDLHVYDPETGASPGQTGKDGYWAEDMLWWGPGGIGSNFRWSGFEKDHRNAFLHAFPDRKGGNHYCRIGDGDYAAVSGWPSMTMTHKGRYLGAEPTGRALTLRVMDFYRCADGKIAENWVLLDYVDLFRQMGHDLIAKGESMV